MCLQFFTNHVLSGGLSQVGGVGVLGFVQFNTNHALDGGFSHDRLG